MTNIREMSCAVSRDERAEILRGGFDDGTGTGRIDRGQLERWTRQQWRQVSRWQQFKDSMVLLGLFIGSGVLFGLAVYGAVSLIREAF